MTENEVASKSALGKLFIYSTLSISAFLFGIFAILVPGFGFYIGIAAIIISLVDIAREIFIFDRVKGIWLDLSAILMGIFGILEMIF